MSCEQSGNCCVRCTDPNRWSRTCPFQPTSGCSNNYRTWNQQRMPGRQEFSIKTNDFQLLHFLLRTNCAAERYTESSRGRRRDAGNAYLLWPASARPSPSTAAAPVESTSCTTNRRVVFVVLGRDEACSVVGIFDSPFMFLPIARTSVCNELLEAECYAETILLLIKCNIGGCAGVYECAVSFSWCNATTGTEPDSQHYCSLSTSSERLICHSCVVWQAQKQTILPPESRGIFHYEKKP